MRGSRAYDTKVQTEYIKRMLGRFVSGRYDESFLQNPESFRYEVETHYDYTRMTYRISVRSGNGMQMALMVADDRMLQDGDWQGYHLQSFEPVMDTLMFIEWFYWNLPEDYKKVYRLHLAPLIKRVTYVPPRVNFGPNYRSRFDNGDGSGKAINPDWLAVVTFKNGAKRREVIKDIHEDSETWFAMMLMIADNRQMAIGE